MTTFATVGILLVVLLAAVGRWRYEVIRDQRADRVIAKVKETVATLLSRGSWTMDTALMINAEETWLLETAKGDVITFSEWQAECAHWDADIILHDADGQRFVTVRCPRCAIVGDWWWNEWVDARMAWAKRDNKCAFYEWTPDKLPNIKGNTYRIASIQQACDCRWCSDQKAAARRTREYTYSGS